MRIKRGVVLAGLNIKMWYVLVAADRIWKDYGKELVITSGLEGRHAAGSVHYYGYALDLRTRYFSRSKIDMVALELRETLGRDFDVIYHLDHIHVEYDILRKVGLV